MANRYASLTPSKKISEDFQNITIGFDKVQQDVDGLQTALTQEIADREAAVEYVDQRVDNIIVGGGPDKDPELVDIRTPAPEYTPLEPIATAGGMTRDMQKQLLAHAEKKATAGQIGHVRPDGTTIQVNGDGVISATDLPTKVSKTGDLMTGDLRMADQFAVTFGGRFKIHYNQALNALEFGVI